MTEHCKDLTLVQQGIHLEHKFFEGTPYHNVGGFFDVKNIDIQRLREALRRVVASHYSFGLRFVESEISVKQFYQEPECALAELVDLSDRDEQEAKSIAQNLLSTAFQSPLPLDGRPLFQSKIFKISESRCWIMCLSHHLLLDGIGFVNVIRAVANVYNGEDPDKVPFSNVDLYLERDRRYLSSSQFARDKSYWQHLDSIVGVRSFEKLQIPVTAGESKRTVIDVTDTLANAVSGFAAKYCVTKARIYLAFVVCYFTRFCQQKQLVVGVPTHGRKKAIDKKDLGVYLNVNPIAFTVEEDDSFLSVLEHMTERQRSVFRHKKYPINQIARDLNLVGDVSRLFQLFFSYLEVNRPIAFDSHEAELNYVSHDHEAVPFKLTVWEDSYKPRTRLMIDIGLDYFEHEQIEELIQRFLVFSETLISNAANSIGSLPLESSEKLHKLYQTGQGDVNCDATALDIWDMLDRSVMANPNVIAVRHCDNALRYEALKNQSLLLASHLYNNGVRTRDFVGICMSRGADLVAVVFACLRLGAAFVPMDPSYPENRLRDILDDSKLKLVVADRQALESVCLLQNIKTITPYAEAISVGASLPTVSFTNLPAYAIYTSGSTGKPKGVVVSQTALSNFMQAMNQSLGNVLDTAHVLSTTTFAFDIALLELLGPLCFGGTVRIASEDESKDIVALRHYLESGEITLAQATPSMWSALISSGFKGHPQLTILSGGETLSEKLSSQLLSCCGKLFNCYGPTEATIWSMAHPISTAHEPVRLSAPLVNYTHFILDPQMRVCCAGQRGELYIGGAGLADAYLHNEPLTDERFPIVELPELGKQRLYKTGDLAMWHGDGTLSLLGRDDSQVKIRGYRIEISEIERALGQISTVSESSIKVWRDSDNGDQIIAYVVAQNEMPFSAKEFVAQVKSQLQAILPIYMVPAEFIVLDGLPLTPNQKVDKSALPKPALMSKPETLECPSSKLEIMLSNLWAAHLNISPEYISCSCGFFDMGGNSIAAMKLSVDLQKRLGKKISLREIFTYSSVHAFASFLEQSSSLEEGSKKLIERVEQGNLAVVSSVQKGIWLADKLQAGTNEYNMVRAFDIHGVLDSALLDKALRVILHQYEVLRTTYFEVNGELFQTVISPENVRFNIVEKDISELSKESKVVELQSLIECESNALFNLAKDCMLRVTLVKVDANACTVIFNIHHIAADGWSVAILTRDLFSLYTAFMNGKDDYKLPEAHLRYIDFAHWQNKQLTQNAYNDQLSFWKKQLAGLPELSTLNIQIATQKNTSRYGGRLLGQPSVSEQAYNALAKTAHLTPFMLFHGVFTLLLSQHIGASDIAVGTPVANRGHAELQEMVGCFINLLVLRTNTEHSNLAEYFEHVRITHVEAQANQEAPFECVLDALDIPRQSTHSPLFQILLTQENTFGVEGELNEKELKLPGAKLIERINITPKIKFDLEVSLSIGSKGLCLQWDYDAGLFSENYIKQLDAHFGVIVQFIVANKSIEKLSLASCKVLPEAESRMLLQDLNDNDADIEIAESVCDFIELNAKRFPTNTAVNHNDNYITYQALNAKANQLARWLQCQQKIGRGSLVGICLDRGIDMLVTLLGIAKTGAAYVPIAPAYPSKRIAFMVEDTDMLLILTESVYHEHLMHSLGQKDRSDIVISTKEERDLDSFEATNLGVQLRPDDLAYIVYTSGSTGQPKGVKTLHANFSNYMFHGIQSFYEGDISGSILATSLTFDGTNPCLYFPLMTGGCVNVISEGKEYTDSVNYLRNHNGRLYVKLTPTQCELLLCEIDAPIYSNHILMLSGEVFTGELFARIKAKLPNAKTYNHYGTTESTMGSCIYEVSGDEGPGPLAAGRPISNTNLYILDDELNPVPFGVLGKLYIGGAGISAGYLNKPELTKEAFIDNPFVETPEKLYCTGDLARYSQGGLVEIAGRIDEQVKINGIRVEPGEIVATINNFPQVEQTVVRFVSGDNGTKQISAYVVAKDNMDNEATKEVCLQGKPDWFAALYSYISKTLPSHLIPNRIGLLNRFPQTYSGKIDCKSLPEIPIVTELNPFDLNDEYERVIAHIWSDLLNIKQTRIGPDSNLFELGGNSTVMVRLVSEINSKFDVTLDFRTLMSDLTVRGVSKLVKNYKVLEKTQEKTYSIVI